ncbi:MAG: LuxR C-terminal-related transcriptional regulator [Chloroflexota bacterium]
MSALPTGTVTFLFTDIEGSTRLVDAQPEAYRVALTRHDQILRAAIELHAGVIFSRQGDGLCAAFSTPSDALRAAIRAQLDLEGEPWHRSTRVRARMALHTGEAQLQDDEYFGVALHRCARLTDSAHGGQIVLSAVSAGLVRDQLPSTVTIRDLGEHRLRGLSQPERVYQATCPGLVSSFPALRAPIDVPTNLPKPTTEFIGRERELVDARALLLRSDSRIVSLTGPGGTGKTRFALKLSSDLTGEFPDGLFFIPLAPIADPRLVPSTIGHSLDVHESPELGMVATLTEYLRTKRLLLILDNFEQVADAVPAISEIVAGTIGLKVLVTSRSPLRLYGEKQFPIPPLSLPERGLSASPNEIERFDGVRLFVERAQAVLPDFRLTDENAADVLEICRRVDGLPLAIELAAARVRSLPPSAMRLRMERSLPLLTSGARDVPERQRTLRDAIRWSYDLLEPDEQKLFRRLSVFRGCTLNSAETVCAGENARPGTASVALEPLNIAVIDGIESLVEKNLLRQSQGQDGDGWYSMLETVREFAMEQLEADGESASVHRRHVLAAMRLAEKAEPELYGSLQSGWLARIHRELNNFRAALDWSEEQGYAEPALRLAVALWWYWSASGRAREGRERLERLIARFPMKPTSNRAELYARALFGAGTLAAVQGDYTAALERQQEGLTLRRALDDPRGIFSALEGVGSAATLLGDLDLAGRCLEEAIHVARVMADPLSTAMALHALGNVSTERGDLTCARSYFLDAINQLQNDTTILGPWAALAVNALDRGDLDEAEGMAAEAVRLCREHGGPHIEVFATATLGAIALERGDLRSAQERMCESLELGQQLGDRAGVAQVLERFVALAVALGRHEDAQRLAGAAEALRERSGASRSLSGQRKLDETLQPARQTLGPQASAEYRRAGRSLTLKQAVAVALEMGATGAEPTPRGSMPLTGPDRPGPLTQREREVALLIAQGLTNRQIAERLVITEGTAASHVVHILGKLDFNSRAQIAAWVASNGGDPLLG